MKNKQQLTETIAYLLSATPDSNTRKLLEFCLSTTIVPENSGKTSLEFAEELIANPDNLSSWTTDVIDSDDDYTVDEMIALGEMKLGDSREFMEKLFEEAGAIDIRD